MVVGRTTPWTVRNYFFRLSCIFTTTTEVDRPLLLFPESPPIGLLVALLRLSGAENSNVQTDQAPPKLHVFPVWVFLILSEGPHV